MGDVLFTIGGNLSAKAGIFSLSPCFSLIVAIFQTHLLVSWNLDAMSAGVV